MNTPATIPTNYTDAGKILGFFEIRNVVEAIIIGLPLVFLIITMSPFGLTLTIIGGAVILVPTCGFALFGIYDYSLFTFLRLYYNWRKGRRIIGYKERGRIFWQNPKKRKNKRNSI